MKQDDSSKILGLQRNIFFAGVEVLYEKMGLSRTSGRGILPH